MKKALLLFAALLVAGCGEKSKKIEKGLTAAGADGRDAGALPSIKGILHPLPTSISSLSHPHPFGPLHSHLPWASLRTRPKKAIY